MTLLTIGSGHRNFSEFTNPKSRDRIAAYGRLVDRSYIIAFTRSGFKKQELGSNVTVFPTNSFHRFMAPVDAWRIGRQILATIPKNESVLVSAQDPFESGVVAWSLLFVRSAKLQLQLHTDFSSPYFRRERWENWIRFLLAKFLIPRADCLRVVSERIKRSLVQGLGIAPNKVVVLPIWSEVSVKGRTEERNDQTLHILMISRLEPEKDVTSAILGFSQLLSRGCMGHLTIVGDGSQRKMLQDLAREQKIESLVSFEGWQSDVSPYYAAADLFLMTSLYEGWGVAAFDALRSGVPVVMTDVGLAGEVIKNHVNGFIVPVRDIFAITEALVYAFHHRDFLEKLSYREVPRAESFDEYLVRYKQALLLTSVIR